MGAPVGDFEGSIHLGTHDDERPIVLERTNRATLDPWNMGWNLWTEYSSFLSDQPPFHVVIKSITRFCLVDVQLILGPAKR